MPKSYLSMEPGAQRAFSNKFDPYLQVYNRLVAYNRIGHPTDKVELIVLGGTWSFYPEEYQIRFIKRSFDAMNDFDSEDKVDYLGEESIEKEEVTEWEELEKVQVENQKARSRCVGLVLETRPDYITKEEVSRLRRFGATKIQIGVQSLDDKVLKMNNRGHGIKETKKAFELLRLAGFKIHAHWMPNLYGSNPEKDIEDYKKLFEMEEFKPDELKIYPCSLIAGTRLFDLYEKGKWEPYTEEQLLYVLGKCLSLTPGYCRLTRVVRDISSDDIVAGNKKTNFRQIVQKHLEEKGIEMKDIRYREIRNKKVKESDLTMKVEGYETTVSTEYFLEYVTKEDKIAGFLRLSIPKEKSFIKEIENTAIIREVHVYGTAVGIGKEEKGKAQHIGLGSKLMEKAENISLEKGFTEISVISSIGTREYYRRKGYEMRGLYQVKVLV
jgi:elongator complex protein 3